MKQGENLEANRNDWEVSSIMEEMISTYAMMPITPWLNVFNRVSALILKNRMSLDQ